MGINTANSNYPCPFCKFRFLGKKQVSANESKLYLQNLKRNWNLDDTQIRRSREESKILYTKKESEDRKGNFNK